VCDCLMQAERALSAWEGEMRKDVESHLSTRVESGVRPVTQVRPSSDCGAARRSAVHVGALRAPKLACESYVRVCVCLCACAQNEKWSWTEAALSELHRALQEQDPARYNDDTMGGPAASAGDVQRVLAADSASFGSGWPTDEWYAQPQNHNTTTTT
jgi:hypothetical protein